jgi:hypothetical protein
MKTRETIEFRSHGGAFVDSTTSSEAYVSVNEARARLRNEGRGRYSEQDSVERGRFR